MKKYTPFFLVAIFAIGFFYLAVIWPAKDTSAEGDNYFRDTVKSVLGTDWLSKPFPTNAPSTLKFVGRYADGKSSGGNYSALGFEWQKFSGVDQIKFSGNRIYAHEVNSTLVAYNQSNFISRLSTEPLKLFYPTSFKPSGGDRIYEDALLPWDSYFYPRHPSENGWILEPCDCHANFHSFDVDDRGYIYMDVLDGLGIARDDGSAIRPVTQIITWPGGLSLNSLPGWPGSLPWLRSGAKGTNKVMSLSGINKPEGMPTVIKSGNNYYLALTGTDTGTTILNVTDPLNPQFIRSVPNEKISNMAQYGETIAVAIMSGSDLAYPFYAGQTEVRIYNKTDFINGAAPKKVFYAQDPAGYAGLVVDQASGKFYSIYYNGNPRLSQTTTASVSVFAPGAGGNAVSYTETKYALGAESVGGASGYIFTAKKLHYNSGYLTAVGIEAGNGPLYERDVKIWSFKSGQPQEIATNKFVSNYYKALDYSASVHTLSGKNYLFVSGVKIADVYELDSVPAATIPTGPVGDGCAAGNTFSTTTGKPCVCVLNPTFPMGTKSQAVKDFQQMLKNLGLYGGKVDGIYGPITKAADLAYCISIKFPIYTAPVPQSAPPIINAVNGPSSLGINQQGTWTVQGSDANLDDLSWSVDWGEGRSVLTCKINPPAGTSQNWSYTASHSWAQAGTYTITFHANDCKGSSTAVKTFKVTISGPGGGRPGDGGQNQTY